MTSSEYVDAEAEVLHPVVRSHPPSGREALYVNPMQRLVVLEDSPPTRAS